MQDAKAGEKQEGVRGMERCNSSKDMKAEVRDGLIIGLIAFGVKGRECSGEGRNNKGRTLKTICPPR